MIKKEVVRVSVTVLKLDDPVNSEYYFGYTLCTEKFYEDLIKFLNHDLYYDGFFGDFEITSIDFID